MAGICGVQTTPGPRAASPDLAPDHHQSTSRYQHMEDKPPLGLQLQAGPGARGPWD